MRVDMEVRGDDAEIDYISFRESVNQVIITVPFSSISNSEFIMTRLEWTKMLRACSLFFMKKEE